MERKEENKNQMRIKAMIHDLRPDCIDSTGISVGVLIVWYDVWEANAWMRDEMLRERGKWWSETVQGKSSFWRDKKNRK